ncbi:hypothetical protein HH212_14900 [Massilia forsythiae]|uniref:Uncharacterized protein n=1 Tax=Massilia forsythiae TaxID=2728020 RepID=A0A7Z2VYE3_9BURK|nr:hypothetical protein [Massilia forsythiae]QJE01162.1 hypothetical protein HH212_14900 [Massilia forsythiae]
MRLPKITASLAALLLSSPFAALPVQAAPADTPAKQRLCKPCRMPSLPIALPRHGMVLAAGSFLSTGSLWYMVDLERGEASRILARDDRTAHKTDIVEHTTRPIPPDDLATLRRIADGIWASTGPLPTVMATDAAWDLWQLDGDDVRRDFGPGDPDGLGKEAKQIMQRLVGVAAPA